MIFDALTCVFGAVVQPKTALVCGLLQSKIHRACDALGFILTGANFSDFDHCRSLLRTHLRSNARFIMNKGYDSDAIRSYVNQHCGVAVIAVNASRAQKPLFDQQLYREPHRIENLFARLISFRRLATRYEKLRVTFAACSLSLASSSSLNSERPSPK